jgi:hypothetical protein
MGGRGWGGVEIFFAVEVRKKGAEVIWTNKIRGGMRI